MRVGLKYLSLVLACIAVPAGAQMTLVGVENGASTVFQGPGDIVSGWVVWGGLRAFSAAKRGTRAINVCDSGNVCNDVNTDAVTGELPASITANATNCSGGGCNVKIIYDQTGANFCTGPAACDFSQTGAVNLRPTLSINCTPNNKWCLNFPGSQAAQLLATPAYTAQQLQPFTFSSIVFGTNNAIGEYWTDTAVNYQIRHTTAAGSIEVYDGTGPFSATMTDAAFHAIQLIFSGPSSFSIRIDSTTTPLSNSGTSGTNQLTIGGGFSLPCVCKMTEMGLFNGAMNSTQQGNMNSNQHTWGGF